LKGYDGLRSLSIAQKVVIAGSQVSIVVLQQTTPQRRPTMTDTIISQSQSVLVAIDISKARHELLIAVPGKARRRRLTVLNQLDDFNRLVATVAEYGHPVPVAFEATGNYHRALACHLSCSSFAKELPKS
jgi:hypothetical protein